jgi:Na+/pantothenate symporter
VFLQVLPQETEGMVLWVIIVAILATIGLAILKSVVASVISFFVLKKVNNEENVKAEARKISVIFFIALAGLLMIFFKNPLSDYIQKPSDDMVFAGLMIIIFAVLVGGLTYRSQAEKGIDRVRNFRKKE